LFVLVATLRNFDELGEKANDIAVLREFVNSHFNPPGTELVEWFPRDWVDFPSTFLSIHDYHHRRWALHLHRIWRDLCRRVCSSFLDLAHRTPAFCSHGFVPNGGRVYYLTRSQPPLLIPMVYDYFLGTGDLEFVMVSNLLYLLIHHTRITSHVRW
ncbi:hypothetical protein ANCDUO_02583, partial [Ancylostoma duodenale]